MRKATHQINRLYLFIPLLLIVMLLFGFFPSPPVMAAPVLSVVPSSGTVGTSVTISGTVFDSYEGDTIHILFDDMELSTVVIPSSGSFTITAVIPADASGGQHVIGAKRETTDSTFFISNHFTVDTRALTITVAEGTVGTSLTLSGTGFYVNKPVDITYNNPDAISIGSVTASATGKFSKSYKIPAGAAGDHKFTAVNDVGNTAGAVFQVVPALQLSAKSGSAGERVTVRGTGFGSSTNVDITLDTSRVAGTGTDSAGNFQAEFVVPQMPTLVYELKIQDAGGNAVRVDFPVTAGATLSDSSGAVGNPVTVSGNDFKAGSTIIVYYDETPVASTTADSEGRFTITFVIPPGSGGDHDISISDGSATRKYSFAVETEPPPPPSLLLPFHNGITGAYADFRWQEVTDPSIPVTYHLEISSDKDFKDIVLKKTGIAVSRYTLTGDDAITVTPEDPVFFWRVAATDGAGNRSPWSEVFSFYVDTPMAPALFLPADGAVISFPVTLNWNAVSSLSEPVIYNLQVSRNAEFTQLLVDEKAIASPSFVIPEKDRRLFNKKIPYYWRVKAVDNARNTGEWSAAGSFNIASNGFPAWAAWTLASFGAVTLVWLTYRFIRRKTYHRDDYYVIHSGGNHEI